MTESIWLPGLVVLALGLVGGIVAALTLRRRPKRKKAADPDLVLQRADLEARRDELYARLREDDLDDDDREEIEIAAARVLGRLEELPAARGAKKSAEVSSPTSAPAPAGVRHPFLVGTAFGLGMAAIVGLLIYWAVVDAKPDPQRGMGMGAPAPGAASQEVPHPEAEMPPELAAMVADLEAQLETDPDDVGARKQLAIRLLEGGQLMPAFEASQELLRRVPEDPDGLYVEAQVRLRMGQFEQVVDLLDRVLERFPEHIRARVARGLAQYQLGNFQAAIEDWEDSLERIEGGHPEIEQMLADARARAFEKMAQGTAPESASPPASESAPSPEPASAPPPSPPAEPMEVAADSYGVRVELAPGTSAPASAVLFASVRAGGGPPSAVKRIPLPSFPLEFTLGPGDTMMGQPLPEAGTLKIQLDADGDVGSQGPQDLVAQAEASLGQGVVVVLGR